MLVENRTSGQADKLLYMHNIPRKYRKLHIVIRFNEYFNNFFFSYPFSEFIYFIFYLYNIY